MSAEELRAAAAYRGQTPSEEDFRADLALMVEQGLAEEVGEGQYAFPPRAELQSVELPNTAQHGVEAVRELLNDILPAVERRDGRGGVVTTRLVVPMGLGDDVVADLRELVRTALFRWAEQEAGAAGEEVAVVFGAAVVSHEDS